MSNPLPPKTSMFWHDNSYTHEEAVQAFDVDKVRLFDARKVRARLETNWLFKLTMKD